MGINKIFLICFGLTFFGSLVAMNRAPWDEGARDTSQQQGCDIEIREDSQENEEGLLRRVRVIWPEVFLRELSSGRRQEFQN